MRDQHDTQTADAFAHKRGRPCIDVNSGPLTPAERARRYRRNRKGDAKSAARAVKKGMPSLLPDYSDAALLDAIRMAMDDVRLFGSPSYQAVLRSLVAELARRYPA